MAYKKVVFSPGAPLDVNELNQLQANITDLQEKTTSSLNNTTVTVGDLETRFNTTPVIEVGTVEVKVNGNTTPVELKNTSFTSPPTVVATIQDDLKPNTSYSVRAKATTARNINIEVTSTDTSASGNINVNYIAIQMRTQN
jgi:hypothetical protein